MKQATLMGAHFLMGSISSRLVIAATLLVFTGLLIVKEAVHEIRKDLR